MYKQYKQFLLAFVLTLFLSAAYCQETVVITLESAVQSALTSNISVKKGAVELNSAKRDYSHSWNSFLPSVTASVNKSADGDTNSSKVKTDTLSAGISASLSLSAGLPVKIAALKAQYESGKSDYEDIIRQTVVEVKKAFYALLYSQQNVELYKSNLSSYQNQYDQTKVKRDRGVVPELDLLSAQVNLETAKLDEKNAEKKYFNALIEFLNTVGIKINPKNTYVLQGSLDDAEVIFASNVKIPDASEIEALVNKSPAVRSVSDSLKIAKLNKYSSISQSYMPSLNLSASVYPVNNSNLSNNDNSWSASAGVSIPLDGIVPGSSAWDSVASNSDEVTKLELELEDKIKTLRTEVFENIHDIEICLSTLNARKLNVELAKKTYEMTEDAYSKGTKDLLSLQTNLDAYHSAVLQWRSEQYNLISYVLDLENTLGLSESLIN